jgi:hypothetical protein
MPWGIEGYKMPNCSSLRLDKPRSVKIINSKTKDFIDIYKKLKEFVPPPHYNVSIDMLSKNKNKYRFSKSPR